MHRTAFRSRSPWVLGRAQAVPIIAAAVLLWNASPNFADHDVRITITALKATPSPFSPSQGVMTFSANVIIDGRNDRGREVHHDERLFLKWAFRVSQGSGRRATVVRTLAGRQQVSGPRPQTIQVLTTFDGRNQTGKQLPDGSYSLVLFVELVRVDEHRHEDRKKDDRKAKEKHDEDDEEILGSATSAPISFVLDGTSPLIRVASVVPPPNPAGWNSTDVTVTFSCSDAGSGIAGCTGPVVVSTEGAGQVITGTAIDRAGNSATTSITISLDKTPPAVSVTSPASGAVLTTSPATFVGMVTDALSGVATVTCNGIAATLTLPSFACVVPLMPGANSVSVQATDVAGNVGSATTSVTFSPLAITDFTPKSGPVGTLITVTGNGFLSSTGARPQVTMNKQGGGSVAVPVSTFGATTLTLVVPAGAASGPLSIAVADQTVTSSRSFTIVAPSSFTLAVTPSTNSLIQGQSTAYAVALRSTDGFDQLAALSVSGLPAGVTSNFTPTQVAAGQTSVLTLTAPATQAPGTTTLAVSASATIAGQLVTQSANATLQVMGVTTAFLGRTVVDDYPRTPIAGVTVKFLGKDGSGNITGCTAQTVSDEAGNFALTGLPPSCTGPQLISYDGTTATSPPGKYAGVNLSYMLTSSQVTVSPVLVHLPRIDDKETVQVQQNAATDQTFTFHTIPNLAVNVYAGTTFTLDDGSQPNPFPLIAIQVPVDRLPDPMPASGLLMPFIVAFQPANAAASQPVAVNFPNTLNTSPGVSTTLMTLDPTRGFMVPYGTGTVSADGTEIVPDPDPAHPAHAYGLLHFDWHGPAVPPNPTNPGPCTTCPPGATCFCPLQAGKPVDLSSGVEVIRATDIGTNGPRGGISISRTYRTLSRNAGPFGIGTNHNYGYQLDTLGLLRGQGVLQLIMPEGNQFALTLQADGAFSNKTIPSLRGVVMTRPSSDVYNLRWKDGTVYQFQSGAGGRVAFLASIRDANGNVITITLNPLVPGQVTQVTDPVGRSLSLNYDPSNRVTSIVDPLGRTVQYTYNSQGTLATLTDPAGGITTYAYDPLANQRLTSVTDPRGVVIAQNTYDSNGRVIKQVQADGGVFTFAYTPLNPEVATSPVSLTVVTDPRRSQTTYRFDPRQFLTDVTDPSGQTKTFTRDPRTNNLVTAITGTASCSACGSASGGDQHFTLDVNGNVLTQTDALGETTTFAYEPNFNKVTSITDALGNVTTFTYDSHGNMLSRRDPNDNVTLFAYNSFGQVTEIADPLGQRTTFSYDGQGNLASTTDPLGNTRSTVYDALSRPVETVDALGRKSTTMYDTLGRVTRETNAQGSSVEFAYDAVGNLMSVTDGRGNETLFTYDGRNRLVTKTDPLGRTDSRSYDFNGNLIKMMDGRGQTSQFTYDALNRLTGEDYQDATVTRSYDANGRLVHVDDSAGGTFDFTYDLAGRLLGSSGPFGSVDYAYDAAGRTISRQVVGQATLVYSYDRAGRLLTASLPQASATLAYDAADRLTALRRANGVTSTDSYDNAGRLVSITHSGGQGINIPITYAYDPAGNRTMQSTGVGQPLITAAASNTYDKANELTQSNSTGVTTSYTYDANGNLATANASGGMTTYTWDSRNRLRSVATSAGPTTNFLYDFAGNLIQQSDSGTSLNVSKTLVLDDLTNVAYVSRSDGDQQSILTGREIDQHLAVAHSGGQIEYALADALTSTTATVDQDGKIASTYLYEPLGQTATLGSYPFQFTGRVPATQDLYYYRARYYDPALGRFISEDPSLIDGRNGYAYGHNAPTETGDPSGLAGLTCTYTVSSGSLACTSASGTFASNGRSGLLQCEGDVNCSGVFGGPIPLCPYRMTYNPGRGWINLMPIGRNCPNRPGLAIHQRGLTIGCIAIPGGDFARLLNLFFGSGSDGMLYVFP